MSTVAVRAGTKIDRDGVDAGQVHDRNGILATIRIGAVGALMSKLDAKTDIVQTGPLEVEASPTLRRPQYRDRRKKLPDSPALDETGPAGVPSSYNHYKANIHRDSRDI